MILKQSKKKINYNPNKAQDLSVRNCIGNSKAIADETDIGILWLKKKKMKKKINYNYLRTCVKELEFPTGWYNYWASGNSYPEITFDDLIKFLKHEKKKKASVQIYFPEEIEPKRIDYGEIEGYYYEIWTNGCYPSVKILGYDGQVYEKHYNSNSDYCGGGYDNGQVWHDVWHKKHTITDIFNDICEIIKQSLQIENYLKEKLL